MGLDAMDPLGEKKELPGERPSLIKARNKHQFLQEVIDDLSAKVTAVGHNHEQEFLSAYRVHQGMNTTASSNSISLLFHRLILMLLMLLSS